MVQIDRIAVYDTIDLERDHQDRKWGGHVHDSEHHIADWILYMDSQLTEAKKALYDEDPDRAMGAIRQAAALAVAAMEYNHTPRRGE